MVHEILLPGRIVYGLGAFSQVGTYAAGLGRKALIVSDPIMEKIGHVETCRIHLQQAGIPSAVYTGVATEPTDRHLQEVLEVCRAEQCDVLIAVGGGSCIDAAKAAAVMMTNSGDISDYVGGSKAFAHRPLPLIAVPTTAGTGSEVTKVTVIINTSTNVKMMIAQPELLPQVAIVDALLCMSCPASVIASSGIDALCHAIEAYWSKKANPMTDGWALQAIDLLIKHLPICYTKKGETEDFAQIALGSMLAGAAFSNASVTLVHGMSRPLGALFHVPHGISNAMLLPAVLEFTAEYAEERVAAIGRIMRPDLAAEGSKRLVLAVIEEVKSLCRLLKIPNLHGWGLDKEQFSSAIPKMAADAIASGSPGNHPRPVTAEVIEALYRTCYAYQIE
ncbi:iron-containing alcohol dehydrogenase [Paenibacillus aestuarii]|uniref:Iron-containing alcohol dehydrogenase n=1 Tax=Paenibacillus aestuarii TaxID=516965 RepID=A0ABW0K8B1_9BACL|nr:iron-containing alcohol dehydrogenase [Paenibacillus aestuarii]